MSLKEVLTSIEEAKPILLEKHREEVAGSEPTSEFPLDLLPSILSNAIREIHDKIGADIKVCGQSVLAVVSLSTQHLAKVEQLQGSFCYINEFFLTVAQSGYRKSSVDGETKEGIHRFESHLRKNYKYDLKKYKIEMDIWKTRHKEILRIAKKSPDDAKLELEQLGDAPKVPIYPSIVLSDPTLDGILKNADSLSNFLALFNDEGGQILGGYSFQKENKARSSSTMSRFWDGSVQDRIRTDEVSQSIRKSLTTHLMIQPEIADILYDDLQITGQGLLSRCLVVKGSPPLHDTAKSGDFYTHEFNQQSYRILSDSMQAFASRDYKITRNITLSLEAKEVLREFSKHLHTMNFDVAKHLCNYINKMTDHAVRLAASIALFQNPNIEQLQKIDVNIGIELCNFYIQQAQAIYQQSGSTGKQRKMMEVVEWIKNNHSGGLIYSSKMLKNGPSFIRSEYELSQMMELLVKSGIVTRETPKEIDGLIRKKVWRLIDA
jgi:hypothetical protein